MKTLKIRDNYEIVGVFAEVHRSKACLTHYSVNFMDSYKDNFLSEEEAIQTAKKLVRNYIKNTGVEML